MASSPSHKLGQIIGEILESAMVKHLQMFASEHNLYLDTIGSRKVRKGKKVTWKDVYGNKHDLDFVLERGGSDDKLGVPVAFIESAWRRYTKHSRNKAQEIQSAVLPLAFTYRNSSPFLGVILAGVFTRGALDQLKSRGFSVLYFEYESVIQAFLKYGVDVTFDEHTTEEEFLTKIDTWDKCTKKDRVIDFLISNNQTKVDDFFKELSNSVNRYVSEVYLLPLHGERLKMGTIEEAITYLGVNDPKDLMKGEFVRIEIKVVYNTSEKIEAQLTDYKAAIKFLNSF